MPETPRVHIEAPRAKLERLRELQRLQAKQDEDLILEERRELLEACPHPALLAKKFDENYVITPAVELVSKQLAETVTARAGRRVVSVPPQEMKTSLLRWLCFWALVNDPSCRIVFASYAEDLARQSGRIVRSYVEGYGPMYGLNTDKSHRDAAEWSLDAGYVGNMTSVGIGGGLTGKPCDCLVIDDPIRNQADADSPTIRANLMEWWQAVARLRLAPDAPVIVVQTRWSETDLAGTLIEQGWPYLNIPALADGKVEDALNREPGTYLESTRGRTPEDWEDIRRDVGERTWAALLQGAPAPVEGGIFKSAWFENGRVQVAPPLHTIVIGVDPAETGTGDEAGILVAGAADDGQLYLLADLSGMLSQAQWARRICIGALRYEAQRVLAERTLGMNTAILDAWRIITRQAAALAAAEVAGTAQPVMYALEILQAAGDDVAADPLELREVAGLEDIVDTFPSTGPRVVTITPKASKRVRAEAVTSLFELGRAHIVGRLPVLEHQSVTWTEGQKSPNRIDVMAHVLSHLEKSRSKAKVARAPRHLQAVPTATVTTLAR